MDKFVTVYCRLLFINPDVRDYRQNTMKVVPSPVYEPDRTLEEMSALHFVVDIPLDREYIHNYLDFRSEEEVLTELGYDDKIEKSDDVEQEEKIVILTLKGAKYLRDILQDEEENTEELEDDETEFDDVDWDE